jgi:shikimate kinase
LSDRAWDSSELDRAAAMARGLRAAAGPDARLFAVRAPGRVNLIGEHTDYSGLPVLPVAIDRSTIIAAVATRSGEVSLRNENRLYPDRDFKLARNIPPYPTGDWANYVKAALQGVIDHFADRGTEVTRLRGAKLVIDGRVPTGAGLSSSAALTVSSALAFMATNGLALSPIETAALVAHSEWYVGTMAGGMDQAASLLGQRDHALFIEFNPLRARPVKMPSEAALVVSDRREEADKSGNDRAEYNRLARACRGGRLWGVYRLRARLGLLPLGDLFGQRLLLDSRALPLVPARLTVVAGVAAHGALAAVPAHHHPGLPVAVSLRGSCWRGRGDVRLFGEKLFFSFWGHTNPLCPILALSGRLG